MGMRTECILTSYSDFNLRQILFQFILTSVAYCQFDIYDIDNYNYSLDSTRNETSLPLIKSLIFPGWGQLSKGDPLWKPFLFVGVEFFAIHSSFSYSNKSKKLRYDFENFADNHWELKRWYDNTKVIFPDNWREIIVGTHKLGLKINDKYYQSENLEELLQRFPWSDIQVVRDRDFYENIGKYDQFVGGWDDDFDNPFDSEGNWYSEKKGNVETVILTKRKDYYRNLRFDSNRYSNFARIATSAILLNHILSGFETILNSKKREPFKSLSIELRPYTIVNEDGVQLILSW